MLDIKKLKGLGPSAREIGSVVELWDDGYRSLSFWVEGLGFRDCEPGALNPKP